MYTVEYKGMDYKDMDKDIVRMWDKKEMGTSIGSPGKRNDL